MTRFSPGNLLAWPLLGLIWLYRYGISPLIGASCRYQPTCSTYAADALRRYGAFKGGYLALKRIGRCNPWGGSGYDPVPGEESAGNGGDEKPINSAGNPAPLNDSDDTP